MEIVASAFVSVVATRHVICVGRASAMKKDWGTPGPSPALTPLNITAISTLDPLTVGNEGVCDGCWGPDMTCGCGKKLRSVCHR